MYLYLTTTGRVTGQPREIEIWFTEVCRNDRSHDPQHGRQDEARGLVFVAGINKFAITAATNPIMIVQRRCIAPPN